MGNRPDRDVHPFSNPNVNTNPTPPKELTDDNYIETVYCSSGCLPNVPNSNLLNCINRVEQLV